MIALLAAAWAADAPKVTLDAGGDVKTFFTATFPYDHLLMPDAPSGQGILDVRLKLDAKFGERLTAQVHHTATALTAAPMAGATQSGVGLQAPELLPLSWVAFDDDLTLRGRIDRLSLSWQPDGVGVTLGRQPITFGNAAVFTPLDLVNPFNPAFIDQEYKPGVDALRVDLYRGVSTKLTLATAYAGSWDRQGLIAAAYGQTTIGVTDVGLFVGSVRGDAVLGTSVVTSVGPVSLTTDVALTAPDGGGDPFVRASVGSFFRPTTKTTITAEAYVQTLGQTRASDLLKTTADARFQRSELWLMGVGYLAVAVAQEITPTVTGSVAVVGNVLDPSAFIAPSLVWSVAGNADLALGGFVGLGARPEPLSPLDLIGPSGPVEPSELTYLRSEFGTYPGVFFTQARMYF